MSYNTQVLDTHIVMCHTFTITSLQTLMVRQTLSCLFQWQAARSKDALTRWAQWTGWLVARPQGGVTHFVIQIRNVINAKRKSTKHTKRNVESAWKLELLKRNCCLLLTHGVGLMIRARLGLRTDHDSQGGRLGLEEKDSYCQIFGIGHLHHLNLIR